MLAQKKEKPEETHGHWRILEDRQVYMYFEGTEHFLILTEKYETMILMKPFRSPPSTAQLIEKSGKRIMPDITGKWNWLHDGVNKNGDIILHEGGLVSHIIGWTGGHWFQQADGRVMVEFNNVMHTMAITENKQNLILVNPARNPPTVA